MSRRQIPVEDLTIAMYREVIDKTIKAVTSEFVHEGADEEILPELRRLWENNLHKSGAIVTEEDREKEEKEREEQERAEREKRRKQEKEKLENERREREKKEAQEREIQARKAQSQPVIASGMPDNSIRQHQQANLSGIPPPQQPVLGNTMHMPQHASTIPNQYISPQGTVMSASSFGMSAGGQPGMQAPMVQMVSPGLQNQQMPQIGMPSPNLNQFPGTISNMQMGMPPYHHSSGNNSSHMHPNIPQRDGQDDEDSDPDGSPTSGSKGNDEELGEEDDLADVDDHEEIDEDDVKNRILGTFEKVHRTKSKWKLNLKNCVATINGKEYLFKKIAGDLDFA